MSSTLSGSCLCGAVEYTVNGDIQSFFHCHCQRCRKASGTGHASNVILASATLTWNSGEDLVRRFKVADARVFENVFCSVCGGRIPRHSAESSYAVVPAGSLDEAPELEVNARIFTGSSAAWSCTGDTLPAFEKYPPRD